MVLLAIVLIVLEIVVLAGDIYMLVRSGHYARLYVLPGLAWPRTSDSGSG